MVYGIQKGGRGGVVYCPIVVECIVTVWAIQVGGRNERTIDSYTNDSNVNESIVKAHLYSLS